MLPPQDCFDFQEQGVFWCTQSTHNPTYVHSNYQWRTLGGMFDYVFLGMLRALPDYDQTKRTHPNPEVPLTLRRTFWLLLDSLSLLLMIDPPRMCLHHGLVCFSVYLISVCCVCVEEDALSWAWGDLRDHRGEEQGGAECACMFVNVVQRCLVRTVKVCHHCCVADAEDYMCRAEKVRVGLSH